MPRRLARIPAPRALILTLLALGAVPASAQPPAAAPPT